MFTNYEEFIDKCDSWWSTVSKLRLAQTDETIAFNQYGEELAKLLEEN